MLRRRSHRWGWILPSVVGASSCVIIVVEVIERRRPLLPSVAGTRGVVVARIAELIWWRGSAVRGGHPLGWSPHGLCSVGSWGPAAADWAGVWHAIATRWMCVSRTRTAHTHWISHRVSHLISHRSRHTPPWWTKTFVWITPLWAVARARWPSPLIGITLLRVRTWGTTSTAHRRPSAIPVTRRRHEVVLHIQTVLTSLSRALAGNI
jgi:hypothetical protein